MAFDKEKILSVAQKFVDKGQHEKALREYQKILEAEPNDQRVLLDVASCCERLGKMDEAADAYVKIYETYRNQGTYQKALAIIKQAQKCKPDSDDIAMDMAEIYSALGLPHEAVNQLEKCLEHAEKSNNRRTYARILQTMVRVDGENIQTRIRYANMLRQDGDTEGAAKQYVLALAQLLSKEKFIDYIQTAREYLKLVPKDAEVLQGLAGIYIRMNRFSDALNILSGIPSQERTPEVREHLIACFAKMGRPQEAVKELKALARQYESMNSRPDLIESVWQRAQKLAPNDTEILLALGGDDIPELSDSAINIISESSVQSSVYDTRNRPQTNNFQNSEMSALSRMLQAKYDEALFYRNRGNNEAALALCMQIIAGNEQHLPALKLAELILEQSGDLGTLAQIERKIARVFYETDIDEAVRHVLRAEQCSPRAWENFNLMLVFGLDPAQYGMKAPESSGVSNPRIPAAQINAAINAQKPSAVPPPLPRKSPQSVNISPSQFAQGAPSLSHPNSGAFAGVPQAARPASGAFAGVSQPAAPRPPVSAPMPPAARPPFAGSQAASAYPADAAPADGSISQIGRALSDNIDNAFDDVFDGVMNAPQTIPAARPVAPQNAAGSQYSPAGQSFGEPIPAWMRRSQQSADARAPSRQSSRATVAAPASVYDTASLMGASDSPTADFGARPQQAGFRRDPSVNNISPNPHAGLSRRQTGNLPTTVAQAPTSAQLGAPSAQLSRIVNPDAAQVPGISRQPSGQIPVMQKSPSGQTPGISRQPSGQIPVLQKSPSGQIPAISRRPSGQIPLMQNPPSAQIPGISRQPSAQVPVMQKSPSGQLPGISRQQSRQIPIVAKQPSGQFPAAQQPAMPQIASGIPPQDRQKVEEAIQEIDFYASLALLGDAKKLLSDLIQKYGDVDIIHDAKIRIEAM